jgi:hypothetical protein
MTLYRDPLYPSNLYEVIKVQTCSGQPLEVTTASGQYTYIQAAPTAGDAFGRLRTSNPYTLFDSNHRYGDNGSWNTLTGVSGTYVFNNDAGLINLNVDATSGSKVYRETKRVFPYQPGKSLQVLNTFVMASGQTNRRQRVGFFSSGNGLFLEQSGEINPAFVLRSSVSGSTIDTAITQENWNVDPLNGTGPSALTLDITKAQILWSDFEWLGVGTVRAGFVINGELIHCHSFQHANIIDSTYMTTATLPLRYEIENVGTASSSGTLRQICSTVISEGGYELRGLGGAAGHAVNAKYDLTATGTFYPIASIRLKSTRPDAAVVLAGLSLVGTTNNATYNWRLIAGGTTTGGSWVDIGSGSAVEYNLTATGFTQGVGRTLSQGYAIGSNQGSTVTDLSKEDLFKYQLERNSFTSTFTELTVLTATDNAGADVVAALNWEEVVY